MNEKTYKPNNVSYDYVDMINELESEADIGALCGADAIQVLRGEPIDVGDGNLYHPIVVWCYDDEDMITMTKVTAMDTEDDAEEKRDILRWYNEVKDDLEELLIDDVLSEMKKWNSVI